MSTVELPSFILDHYEVHEWRHAAAVLQKDFPDEWTDICGVLTEFRLLASDISKGGGNKSPVARRIDSRFRELGWIERGFQVAINVDTESYPSPTHTVDNFKNKIAVEVEWNNKDPFYDRDLNNFRLLHQLRVVSVGVIVTRSDELQDIFDEIGRGSSYGESTTHMSKLLPKIEGGGAAGCPLLVFGITKKLYESER